MGVRGERETVAKQRPTQLSPDPRLSDSLEELYSPEYLRDCASGHARRERLEEIKRRIDSCAYRVDPDRLAEELLLRGDLD